MALSRYCKLITPTYKICDCDIRFCYLFDSDVIFKLSNPLSASGGTSVRIMNILSF